MTSNRTAKHLRTAVLTRTGRTSGLRLARAVHDSRHELCGIIAERRSTMILRSLRRESARGFLQKYGLSLLLSRVKQAVTSSGREAAVAAPTGVPYYRVADMNAPETVRLLDMWRPDLLIVANAPILGPATVEHCRLGAINFHSGHLPEYGGVASEFWALYTGQSQVWATLHWVKAELDSGGILAERAVPIRRTDTPDTLHGKCVAAAQETLSGVLGRLACGDMSIVRDPGPATLRPWPTSRQRRELRKRC